MRLINIRLIAALLGTLPLTAFSETPPPDLSGVWSPPFEVHSSGIPMLGGSSVWMPLSGGDPRKSHIATLAEIGAGFDAYAKSDHKGPPASTQPSAVPYMTPAGKAALARYDRALDTKHGLSCYPYNIFERLAGGLGALEIVQSPKVVALATEVNGDNFPRLIYLDGRKADNALPNFEGYSLGRWVGRTLRVETVKIKGDYMEFLDHSAWPVSEDAHLIEEFTKIDGGKKLEIMQTLVDPVNYTEPMRRVSYLDWRPDLELHDFPCEEGRDDQPEMNSSR